MVCTNYCLCVCITRQSLDTRDQNNILVIRIMQNNLIKVLLQFIILEMCACSVCVCFFDDTISANVVALKITLKVVCVMSNLSDCGNNSHCLLTLNV